MHTIMTVAIDGLAGCGKTSISNCLGKACGMTVISSGLLYRYVAYRAEGSQQKAVVLRHAEEIRLHVDSENRMQIDAFDDTALLYTPQVEVDASRIAPLAALREILNEKMRGLMRGLSCIVEGRDATSAIAPEAQLKIFLTAQEELRSRRIAERQGTSVEFSHAAMRERDGRDSTRTRAKMKLAEDLLIFDTSNLTLQEVCDTLMELIDTASRNIVHGT